MFKRFMHLTTIVILILAISVSFAWMIDVTAPSGHFPVLRFEEENRLYVASSDVDVDVSVEENDEYVPILSTSNENNQIFSASNLGPGSVKKYKMVIKNNTEAELNMSIILSGITASIDEFYDNIYIGTFATSGFAFPYNPPIVNEFKLSDDLIIAKDGTASRNLIDYFKIPGDFSTVEIRFYVRIGIEGGNELQNQNFSIGNINFVII